MSAYGFQSLQVFSTCDKTGMDRVAELATELGLAHSGVIHLPLNSNWFLTVYPSGSKLGWPEATKHQEDLYKLITCCHKRNLEEGDIFIHFVLINCYEHEQLCTMQHLIELAV